MSAVEVLPRDEHNAKLINNVHPADWTNPKPAESYNLVVIGAGTAGLVTAAGAAGLGAKVALIERHLMGGDCLNVGCVPSKCLIAAAKAAHMARGGADKYGVRIPKGSAEIDFGAVMERMRSLRAGISRHDSVKRFADMGIDVFLGEAEFTDSNTIIVRSDKGDIALPFKKAVIATGARAAAPPIPGLDQIDCLTNENLFSLTELPKRLGIVGAGPIGVEMAQAFARFGSEVYQVEAEHGVLPREDPDASQIIHDAIKADGVKLLCCGKQLNFSKSANGTIRMQVDSHDNHYDHEVDQLLVSVGRAPNVEGLGLEKVGVDFDKKGVTVDDHLRTTNPNIYAAGDVAMKYQFTHAADFAARIVIQNSLFFGRKKLSALTMPWCTYTEPEIAHVGLYPKEAEEQGIEIDTYRVDMSDVDRAVTDGETEGFVKVHTRKGKGSIVGATIVAAHAGDLISEISTAMAAKMGLGGLAGVIHPYPTQAEAIRKAGDAFNRTRLTPTVKWLMEKWLSWTR